MANASAGRLVVNQGWVLIWKLMMRCAIISTVSNSEQQLHHFITYLFHCQPLKNNELQLSGAWELVYPYLIHLKSLVWIRHQEVTEEVMTLRRNRDVRRCSPLGRQDKRCYLSGSHVLTVPAPSASMSCWERRCIKGVPSKEHYVQHHAATPDICRIPLVVPLVLQYLWCLWVLESVLKCVYPPLRDTLLTMYAIVPTLDFGAEFVSDLE